MKVLLLFTSSELGGAERSLTRMATFPQSEIQYYLGTLDGKGQWTQWVEELGFQPLIFGEKKSASTHGNFNWKSIISAIRFIKNHSIDIVYVIGLRASLFLRFSKLLLKKTKIVHGVRWNPHSTSRLDIAFRQIERWSNSLIDYYIVNSKASAKTLQTDCNIPAHKIEVIYNGVFEFPHNLIPYKQRPFHIVTIANFSPRKGYLEYLPVVHKVIEQFPEVKFYFIGRDDMNGKVHRAIQNQELEKNIYCLNFQKDISFFLQNARVFVLPSLWGEGCPTSILEAFSYGVPVIAYSIDGVPELIENGHNGFLISKNSHEEMVKKIISTLEDVDKATSMGYEARLEVRNKFSLNTCVKKHLSVMKNL